MHKTVEAKRTTAVARTCRNKSLGIFLSKRANYPIRVGAHPDRVTYLNWGSYVRRWVFLMTRDDQRLTHVLTTPVADICTIRSVEDEGFVTPTSWGERDEITPHKALKLIA